MWRFIRCITLCCFVTASPVARGDDSLKKDAATALDKSLQYYYSLAEGNGYLSSYTPELAENLQQGDQVISRIDANSSGTQAVGQAYLRAYAVTGKQQYLDYAKKVGEALVRGQRESGGWHSDIILGSRQPEPYGRLWSPVTQRIVLFLMELAEHTDDQTIAHALERGLQFMVDSQLEIGGWPPYYPLRGGSYNCASMNDGSFNACVDVMLEAHRRYGKPEYLKALQKAAHFLHIVQLPPPTAGWAQHYSLYGQPVWFRSYEPPAVNSQVTQQCINTLMDMFLELGEGGSPENGSNWYLEPIPDALRWLRDSRLPNGQWARYYEIATNTPLYYDRGRKRVPSFDQLGRERQTGYAYHVTIDINALTERYNAITRLGRAAYLKQENQPDSDEAKRNRLQQLEEQVSRIIGVQHTSGSWITTERFRSKFGPGKPWDGMYEEEQRITGKVFLTHVRTLCDYIELSRD